MDVRNAIDNPSDIHAWPYEPGLCVRFDRTRADSSIDELTSAPRLETGFANLSKGDESGEVDAVIALSRALVRLEICANEHEFVDSLKAFAREDDLVRAARHTIATLLPSEQESTRTMPASTASTPSVSAGLVMLLRHLGVLRAPRADPLRVFCHIPGTITELEPDATHFGYVLRGGESFAITREGRCHLLYPESYFCLVGETQVRGQGHILLISAFGYEGLPVVSGALGEWGRLRYIDGCSDTLLVPPVKKGDPCFNALYFPYQTKQTPHTHPSVRAGAVVGGSGTCVTSSRTLPLSRDTVFVMPPETQHAFQTSHAPSPERAALTVVAFHPDSDFGPTDEDHPMLNRTYFRFLHRLRSAERSVALGSV